MTTFTKWVKVGAMRPGESQSAFLFVEIKWDGKRLSIVGVDGPKANGDAIGGCGQCIDALSDVKPPLVDVERLREVWARWHLNDMRAGCEHQRAVDEHTIGAKCSECGYRYGSVWLHEDVPADVIEYLASLPATDVPQGWR